MKRRREKRIVPGGPPASEPVFPVRPEWVFAVLATAAGLFMVFVTPPFQSPDEDAHFWRTLQLSEGVIIAREVDGSVGGDIPEPACDVWEKFARVKWGGRASIDTIREALKVRYASEPRRFVPFIHTAIYSPVAYAPAVAGVLVAKLLGSSVLHLAYASRLATLLCWVPLMVVAIRTMPVFKWVTVLLVLMPMTVFLSASPSADVMTNALAILLVAVIMRSAVATEGPVSRREWACVIALAAMLSLTKQVYFLLAAMTFIIPVERFGRRGRKWLMCLLVVGAAVAANIAWALMVRNVVTTEEWADPYRQTLFILTQPWQYVIVLLTTLKVWWWTYIKWFVGVLGWLDTWLPSWIYSTYIAVFILGAALDRGVGRPMHTAEKVFLAAIWFATVLLIFTSQYITYSKPMAETVRGVQGRYFIPMVLPLLLVLYNRRLRVPERDVGTGVTLYCAVVLIMACRALVLRFYY